MRHLISMLASYGRDICEIAFLSTAFYHVALWLKKDKAHNLLPSFYGFIFLYAGSYLLNLNTIHYLLSCTWPLLATLFIIVHQVTLQRNFVALKNSAHIRNPVCSMWLETLLATNLQTLNRSLPLFCVIERSDSLEAWLDTPLTIDAPINKKLLELVYTSSTINHSKIIWVTGTGYIKAINGVWKDDSTGITHNLSLAPSPTTIMQDTHTMAQDWIASTARHTHNTDAIAFYGDPLTHKFTAIFGENIVPNLTGHQLYSILIREKVVTPVKRDISPTVTKQEHIYVQHKKHTYQHHNT